VDGFTGVEAGVPGMWAEELKKLAPGQASAVKQAGGSWAYVVLRERSAARLMTPLETFARVEAILTEQKLPAVFDQWLTRAVLSADIRIARQFQPGNTSRPSPAADIPGESAGDARPTSRSAYP
jgi:hypothetical protein